jgi:hypothetical protein
MKKANDPCETITEVISRTGGFGFPREHFIPLLTVYKARYLKSIYFSAKSSHNGMGEVP